MKSALGRTVRGRRSGGEGAPTGCAQPEVGAPVRKGPGRGGAKAGPRTWRRARRFPLLLPLFLLAGCGGAAPQHPWLAPEGAPLPFQILESLGSSGGQLVLLVDYTASPEEVLELGEWVLTRAPAGSTVNARIFNDENTALQWRTAPAIWTLEHLLAVATQNPSTGTRQVRWVKGAAVEDGVVGPPDGIGGGGTTTEGGAAMEGGAVPVDSGTVVGTPEAAPPTP